MALCRLVYLSEATQRFTDNELRVLIEEAARNNAERGITGLLVCSGDHFLQVLEGAELQVLSVYRKIARDPRHRNVEQLLCREAEQRMFPDWGMNIVNADNASSLDRERINKTLLHLRMSEGNGENDAMALLEEFRRQFESRKSA
jgi:hypothetical protein